jgi:FkbM family methyltransferase
MDSFKVGEMFWDIGANIGCYSLYAARRGIQTAAFEPSAYNFFVLQKNIDINRFNHIITAYPIALSNSNGFGKLLLSEEGIGGADNTFSTDKRSERIQGSVSFTIDTLIEQGYIPSPDHIKIDVDGIERDILSGAEKSLQSVKSILIEINRDSSEGKEIITYLEKNKFTSESKNQLVMVASSHCNAFFNYIFKNTRFTS